jgi:hypothetical protein
MTVHDSLFCIMTLAPQAERDTLEAKLEEARNAEDGAAAEAAGCRMSAEAAGAEARRLAAKVQRLAAALDSEQRELQRCGGWGVNLTATAGPRTA